MKGSDTVNRTKKGQKEIERQGRHEKSKKKKNVSQSKSSKLYLRIIQYEAVFFFLIPRSRSQEIYTALKGCSGITQVRF